MQTIPLSRLKRELRQVLRFLENHPDQVVYVSRNKKVVFVLTGITHYETMVSLTEED